LLYAVPYVGALVTALITFLVGFAAGGAAFGGIAAGSVVVLNQVFDNVVTPRVVGGGVGLHPVAAVFRARSGRRTVRAVGLAAIGAACRKRPGDFVSAIPQTHNAHAARVFACSGHSSERTGSRQRYWKVTSRTWRDRRRHDDSGAMSRRAPAARRGHNGARRSRERR
jgi:hypothetical protein